MQGTLGNIFAIILMIPVGFFIDRISVKIMLPIVFTIRAGVYFLVSTITNPVKQKYMFFTLVPLSTATFYMVLIAFNSYLYKMYPKNIRATCNMVSHIFIILPNFITPVFFRFLYHKNPKLPFLGVSIMDVIGMILCIISFLFGFGNLPKAANGDDESNLSGSIGSDSDEKDAN
jgi:MFS family permease